MKKFVLLSMLFLLPACAQTELASHMLKQTPIADNEQPPGYFKVGKSYRIMGQRYTPRESYDHSEVGIASWYGPNFHGKMTANGETFDKFEMTAAHRTLQMPSIVRVTNLENGRSVVLRVNDRGPFAKDRVIDVSERAAELLAFKKQGTARVRVEVMGDESRQVASLAKQGYATRGYEIALNDPNAPHQNHAFRTASKTHARHHAITNTPSPTPLHKPVLAEHAVPQPKPVLVASPLDPGIYVQAGAFGERGSADALARQLNNLGAANVSPANVNGDKFYRVRFGPFDSQTKASQMVASLASENISAPIIIVE